MDLLQELISLTEKKAKKPCCSKCEKKMTKEIANKLMSSSNLKESLMEIFSDQINEGKSIGYIENNSSNRRIMCLHDDIENPFLHKIAKAMGVHDGGNLKKVADKLFVSYVHGADLTFFEDPQDHEGEE